MLARVPFGEFPLAALHERPLRCPAVPGHDRLEVFFESACRNYPTDATLVNLW